MRHGVDWVKVQEGKRDRGRIWAEMAGAEVYVAKAAMIAYRFAR